MRSVKEAIYNSHVVLEEHAGIKVRSDVQMMIANPARDQVVDSVRANIAVSVRDFLGIKLR